MAVNVLLSRWLTPKHILFYDAVVGNGYGDGDGDVDGDGDDTTEKPNGAAPRLAETANVHKRQVTFRKEYKYLNVNLSHELWKDITFKSLQIRHDDPPVHVYLWRLLWRWQVFNGIILLVVLRPFSKYFLEQ